MKITKEWAREQDSLYLAEMAALLIGELLNRGGPFKDLYETLNYLLRAVIRRESNIERMELKALSVHTD